MIAGYARTWLKKINLHKCERSGHLSVEWSERVKSLPPQTPMWQGPRVSADGQGLAATGGPTQQADLIWHLRTQSLPSGEGSGTGLDWGTQLQEL